MQARSVRQSCIAACLGAGAPLGKRRKKNIEGGGEDTFVNEILHLISMKLKICGNTLLWRAQPLRCTGLSTAFYSLETLLHSISSWGSEMIVSNTVHKRTHLMDMLPCTCTRIMFYASQTHTRIMKKRPKDMNTICKLYLITDKINCNDFYAAGILWRIWPLLDNGSVKTFS